MGVKISGSSSGPITETTTTTEEVKFQEADRRLGYAAPIPGQQEKLKALKEELEALKKNTT